MKARKVYNTLCLKEITQINKLATVASFFVFRYLFMTQESHYYYYYFTSLFPLCRRRKVNCVSIKYTHTKKIQKPGTKASE